MEIAKGRKVLTQRQLLQALSRPWRVLVRDLPEEPGQERFRIVEPGNQTVAEVMPYVAHAWIRSFADKLEDPRHGPSPNTWRLPTELWLQDEPSAKESPH